MARLTPSPKQAETLQHIRSYIKEKGYSPTVAELANLAEVNTNAVQDRLNALERKGLITRAPGTVRTIRPAS
ncbi:GntR family transcriptional regulator [Pseudomonas sp. BN414]|uniref:LexA family protein n=1 Tax=Pseudomonas sp. BN414 TaxID=2567888 RepID=UPI002453CE72|nr:GntR family transcriptional regulator [Pseudomonas sp. BN414]MDH4566145.1 GntR family transcriptional regulator [Pseudomonas sp. BN414]